MFLDQINDKIDIHNPVVLSVADKEFLLNHIGLESREYREILQKVKKEKSTQIKFYSSQPPFIFQNIHNLCNSFIPDISHQIDILVREIVKNAEKENITLLAKNLGLVPQDTKCAPLFLIRKILHEEIHSEDGFPILYFNPEIRIGVKISLKDNGIMNNNELSFEIMNYGKIQLENERLISKRIGLGIKLARFDLSQEFEMRDYEASKETIMEFIQTEYPDEDILSLWMEVFDISFEDYWKTSPYFLMLSAGSHTSFYPFYAMAYEQLRSNKIKKENPAATHYSAGMGYIQCSFVVEANRNLYGTYGRILTPYVRGNHTVAGFNLGLPNVDIKA